MFKKMMHFKLLIVSALMLAVFAHGTNGTPVDKMSEMLQSALDRLENSQIQWQKVAMKKAAEIDYLTKQIQHQQSLLNELLLIQQKKMGNSAVAPRALPRTCEEVFLANPSTESGEYVIDPDGSNGDPSFTVYCDKDTGATMVGHDAEDKYQIPTASACTPAGCYERPIKYDATERQMQTLTLLSNTCRQFFRFDCLGVPFEFNNVAFAFWTDRSGAQQRIWAGSLDAAVAHTCQCGLDKDCVDQSVNCNCDALTPAAQFDEGYVEDKTRLPFTKLNFGRIGTGALAAHTLGKYECSGRTVLVGPPKSCSDLWQSGQTQNGIYTVTDGTVVRFVNCDFSVLPGDDGHETEITCVDANACTK